MTTRPPSNDPADVAAWEEERARLREEREFRDDVRTFIGQQGESTRGMREDITALRSDMAAHEQRDKERFAQVEGRFGPVTQSIDSNDRKFYWIVGIGVGAVGVVALVGLYLTTRGAA